MIDEALFFPLFPSAPIQRPFPPPGFFFISKRLYFSPSFFLKESPQHPPCQQGYVFLTPLYTPLRPFFSSLSLPLKPHFSQYHSLSLVLSPPCFSPHPPIPPTALFFLFSSFPILLHTYPPPSPLPSFLSRILPTPPSPFPSPLPLLTPPSLEPSLAGCSLAFYQSFALALPMRTLPTSL